MGSVADGTHLGTGIPARLADLYFAGHIDECIDECRAAISASRYHWQAYLFQSQCLDVLGRSDDSVIVLRKCYEEANRLTCLDSCCDKREMLLADFYFQTRDFTRCIKWAREALNRRPGDALCLRLLGMAEGLQRKLGILNDALEEMVLRRLHKLFPEDLRVKNDLRELETKQNRRSPQLSSDPRPEGGSQFPDLNARIIYLYIPDVLFHANSNAVETERAIYAELYQCLRAANVPFAVHAQGSYAPCLDTSNNIIHLTWHTRGRAKNTFHIKDAALPGLFYIDHSGFSGWAESASFIELPDEGNSPTDEELEKWFCSLQERYISTHLSKYHQARRNFLGQRPYVFFALQNHDDEVLSLSRIDMLEFLLTVSLITKRNSINLVVKRHPHCRSPRVLEVLERLSQEQHVQISDASIHDIIPRSEAVLTVNSGVGFEALLHLKHVIIAGSADYQWACHSVSSTIELQELPKIISSAVDADRIKRFLHCVCNTYLCDVNATERTVERLRSLCFASVGR